MPSRKDVVTPACGCVVGGVASTVTAVLVFLLLGLSALFRFSPAPTRVTEDGLVFEQQFRGYSMGTKLVEWKNFEGYRVEDDSLVIVYEHRWRDLVYDQAKIDDLDRTTAVLDRYLPELPDGER